jgi:hypothetical protein
MIHSQWGQELSLGSSGGIFDAAFELDSGKGRETFSGAESEELVHVVPRVEEQGSAASYIVTSTAWIGALHISNTLISPPLAFESLRCALVRICTALQDGQDMHIRAAHFCLAEN